MTAPKRLKQKTFGAIKYSGGKNATSDVKGWGNHGAMIPSAVDMIEKLKKVSGNPTSIDSVGAQNLMNAIKQIVNLFEKNKKGSKINCAIENRGNLTPEELEYCERLDKISQASNGRGNEEETS